MIVDHFLIFNCRWLVEKNHKERQGAKTANLYGTTEEYPLRAELIYTIVCK